MQYIKQPSYLIWLNRIIILFILLNLTIISSLFNLADTWAEISSGVNFCEMNYCGVVIFFTQPFISYIGYVAMLTVVLKEWVFKLLLTRLKMNALLFILTLAIVIIFFALFYGPINNMGQLL